MNTKFVLCIFLAGSITGCARIELPRMPDPIQEIIAPQALAWQHKDVSELEVPFHAAPMDGSTEERFTVVEQQLDRLKYHPRSMSGIKATLISATTDDELERKRKDQDRTEAGRWGRLAKQPSFQRVTIPAADGFSLSGVLAMPDRQRPSVIILPGTFDSCDALYVRDTALFLLAHGYNVLVVEARDHGLSMDAWTSLGWKESEDVLWAARWLKDLSGSGASVGVIGFSLGAWYAVRAGYEASVRGEADLLNGGVIAFSPPIEIDQAVMDWDRPEFRGNALTLRGQVFEQFDAYLHKRVRKAGKWEEFKAAGGDFGAYMDLAARSYGLADRHELYAKACVPVNELVARMAVPLVVFHAKDDPVVRVQHTIRLKKAVESHPSSWIKVIVQKKGGHIALHELDPNYYVNLLSIVLDGLSQEGVSL